MNKRFRVSFRPRSLAIGGSGFLPLLALAAPPTEVTTAITNAGADLVTVMTAVIVAFVAFWGLRKLAAKFGWM